MFTTKATATTNHVTAPHMNEKRKKSMAGGSVIVNNLTHQSYRQQHSQLIPTQTVQSNQSVYVPSLNVQRKSVSFDPRTQYNALKLQQSQQPNVPPPQAPPKDNSKINMFKIRE
jgi:hypothetical protein